MASVTFDKLAYVDRLKAAGVDEAMARAMADSLDTALHESVATKADLEVLGARLTGRMGRLEGLIGVNLTVTLLVLGKLVLMP